MIELPSLPCGESASPRTSRRRPLVPLRQAPQGLRGQPEQVDRRDRPREATPSRTSSRPRGKPDKRAIFNNSAQVWNHTFYWNSSLSPKGAVSRRQAGSTPIEATFGDFADSFKDDVRQGRGRPSSASRLGLARPRGRQLKVEQTANAETPMRGRRRSRLLTIDVWEHAYYVDYRNAPPEVHRDASSTSS